MSDYSLNVGNLAQGFCPTTYQQMKAGFGQALSVSIPSASGISISATPPSDTSLIWFQIDSLNRFIRMFTYAQGTWLSAHPMLPGMTMWWFSALPAAPDSNGGLGTFDGGDTTTITPAAASGAMWKLAYDGNNDLITAQFPVTAGTLPSGAPLTVSGATNVGGEELHLLTTAEGAQDPAHQHVLGKYGGNESAYFNYSMTSNVNSGNIFGFSVSGGGTTTTTIQALAAYNFYLSFGINPTPSAVTKHNCLPPFVVGFLLQRSNRLFYSVT